MSLSPGTRLAHFEVIAPIGAGGMGEVYKARDTRLDRTVAIKVLPEHLAKSPERKARLEREAKAISQLNHPHICTLYDVGEQDGIDFIVMEYIEGETLAERLKKGALKFDQALEYGIQIADGLDKAHRQGIVHRDLKPSNIMLSKSGVKVLDFGLAKRDGRGVDGVLNTSVRTQTRNVTEDGVIVGTLQYMAPEQLEGKGVDLRADLFALGGILYEALTGRPAFEGESQASLIAAILEHDPEPVSDLTPNSSPAVDHAVRRCLQKDPDDRWQSALDLRNELLWASEFVPLKETPSGLPRRRAHGYLPVVVAIVALAVGLLAGTRLASRVMSVEPIVVAGLPIEPRRIDLEGVDAYGSVVAISPEGSYVAYVGKEGYEYLLAGDRSRAGATSRRYRASLRPFLFARQPVVGILLHRAAWTLEGASRWRCPRHDRRRNLCPGSELGHR